MALQLLLEEHLGEATFSCALALDGTVAYTPTESIGVDVYWRFDDEPEAEPQYLGTTTTGNSLIVPFSAYTRAIRLFEISRTETAVASDSSFSTAESTLFDFGSAPDPGEVAALAPQIIFDRYADKTTAGTAAELLWLDQIDAGLLAANGDKIDAKYTWKHAANTHSKAVSIYWNATLLATVTTAENNTTGTINVWFQRVSNSVVRYAVIPATSAHQSPSYGEITGLDLAADPQSLEVWGTTSDAAGDLTLKMGYGLYIPTVAETTTYLFDEATGDFLTDESGNYLISE